MTSAPELEKPVEVASEASANFLGVTTYGLARIKKRLRNEAFLKRGAVRFSRIETYRRGENPAVNDRNEGALLYFSGSNTSLRVSVQPEVPGAVPFPIQIVEARVDAPEKHHGVFCMTGFPITAGTVKPSAHLRDPRWAALGDSIVLIQHNTAFVRRFAKAAERAGYPVTLRDVEYLPQDYCGRMNPFQKLASYSYQAEWRFVTDRPLESDYLDIEIGSLEDVAILIDRWR